MHRHSSGWCPWSACDQAGQGVGARGRRAWYRAGAAARRPWPRHLPRRHLWRHRGPSEVSPPEESRPASAPGPVATTGPGADSAPAGTWRSRSPRAVEPPSPARLIRNQTAFPGPGLSTTPHSSASSLTICSPLPWGSRVVGRLSDGRPSPRSTTSTRTWRSPRSTLTSNPLDAWVRALVANSDTIRIAELWRSGARSVTACWTNRLLAATDAGDASKTRLRFIGPIRTRHRDRWPPTPSGRWARHRSVPPGRPGSPPAPTGRFRSCP